MGQAKRRKQQLGEAYGTPEGGNAEQRRDALCFRRMSEEEVTGVPPHLKGDGFAHVVCSIGGKSFSVAVKCVIDKWGKFNSYVYGGAGGLSIPGRPFQGTRKNADHRALNRFILDTTDVIFTNMPEHDHA